MDKFSSDMLNFNKDKKIVGIDIGSFDIKFVVIEIWPSKVILSKTISRQFPPEEEAADRKKFIIDSIKETLTQENLLTDEVYLLCPSDLYEIKRVQLPYMPAKEIPGALKWQLSEKISFGIENALINFGITDELVSEDGLQSLVVMAACADKARLDEELFYLKPLNLISVGMYAASFGIESILSMSGQVAADETVAVVEIGNNHTDISVYKNRKLVAVRKLHISSSEIQKAMCGVFASEIGKIELFYRDAGQIKHKYGIPNENEKISPQDISAHQLLSMIRPILEELALEIRRTNDYYVSQLSGKPFAKILLTGGGSLLKNIDVFLAKELGLPVEYLKLPQAITTHYADNQDIVPYISLCSIMLEGPSAKVNMLPEQMRVQKINVIQKISLRLFIIAAVFIIALAHTFLILKINNYKARLASVQAHYGAIQPVTALYERVTEMGKAIECVKQSSSYPSVMLKEISIIVPANIMLLELNIDVGAKSVVLKGILDFSGYSGDTQEALTRFIESIEKSRFFKEARLVSWERLNLVDKLVSNFEIKCIFQ